MWENERSNGLTERAQCTSLTDNIHIVKWQGADYTIQGPGPIWKIRRRGSPGVLHLFTEIDGFGKEEVIAWIEQNF